MSLSEVLAATDMAGCRKKPRVVAIEELRNPCGIRCDHDERGRCRRKRPPRRYVVVILRFGEYGVARCPVRKDVALWLMGVR